jgi:integrase
MGHLTASEPPSNVVPLRRQPKSGTVRRTVGSWDLVEAKLEAEGERLAREAAEARALDAEDRALCAEAVANRHVEAALGGIRELLATQPPAPARALYVSPETCDEWALRHFAWREKQGVQTYADAGRHWQEGTWGGRWGTWISPLVGHMCAATLARSDVEDVRANLNEAIRLYYVEGKGTPGATSWKNAMHAWSCLTTACKQMCGAERDSGLKVRDDNPALGVPPPRRPAGMKKKALQKQKRILRPNEFLDVLGHEKLSRDWREAYGVLGYSYLRPGEARVLEWSDVDFDTGFIHVNKAWDYERKKIRDHTKTGAPRDVPIEPTLRPLLLWMRDRAKGRGLVLPILSRVNANNLSRDFRQRLKSAGVNRAELHRGSATEKKVGFRQLRDFGVTMRLWRGDSPLVVKRHADHEDFETLLLYTVEIEKLTAACGVPFPELPECLVPKKYRQAGPKEGTPKEGAGAPKEGPDLYRRRDSNPHARKDGGF